MPEEISQRKRNEFITRLKDFLSRKYKKELFKAAEEGRALEVDIQLLDKAHPDIVDFLKEQPETIFEIMQEAVERIELSAPVKVRFKNHTETVNIRDLRAKNIGKFLCIEGIVRRASEIRPEIIASVWECHECGEKIEQEARLGFVSKPYKCDCGNTKGFKQIDAKLMDTRRIVIDEPFELTEGEKPSQLNVILQDDLCSQEGRRMTDPGNRLKITGILRDIPKGKSFSSKLDFYFEANHIEPTEVGWERVEISKEDERKIKKLAKDPKIYEKLVKSLAPSLYGMEEIKEAIILQLFGGVPKIMKDNTKIRGNIHILLLGDPASGKSQLMKLVPNIIPRGRYVSGKGVSLAGLTATVVKDEQFMGGWVLEAGAMVLANKGILAVDEFEKMNPDDSIAMHEGLEQGTVSIAKASIVATLPAETSVLAGGNPKFSRFDPMLPIMQQITIVPTLLSRFDLKFILKDTPNVAKDRLVVEHMLKAREDENYEGAKPIIEPELIKKYIAYAKEKCKPELTPDVGKILKDFYINSRKKAEEEGSPVPITLRQFEAMIRLAEASAKIQLSDKIRKEDAKRAIRLMTHSLRQLGFDPVTGKIDVDLAEGGLASSERSKIRIVMDIINRLSEKKKEISIGEIATTARKEGVEEVEEIIEKLKREGMLFEPSSGYVQKI